MNSESKLKADVQEFVPKFYSGPVNNGQKTIKNLPNQKNLNEGDIIKMPQQPEHNSGLMKDQCYSLFPDKKKKVRSKKSPDKLMVETNFKFVDNPTYKVLPRVQNVTENIGPSWPGLVEDPRTISQNSKGVNAAPKPRSFADMVKTAPPAPAVVINEDMQDDSNRKNEKNLYNSNKKLEDRLKLSKNNTAMTSILLNKNKKQKAVVNQISASTYGRIGKSDDESKYVMSKINADMEDNRNRSPVVRHELEVEFKEPDFHFSSDDDFEVEFSASAGPRPGKNVVNKISAMTFQQIGKTSDNEKYVMKPKSWSSVVGKGLKSAPDQKSDTSRNDVLEIQAKPKGEPTVHDKIRAKMKENVELTPEEREILRQKRRERRKREKENKRKDKEEEKRKEMLKPQTSKLRLISSNILDQVKQSPSSNKDTNVKDKGIKFLDEEYPDLGVVQKKSLQDIKKERVISSEIRDENGKLTSDRESNSEWETEDECKDPVNNISENYSTPDVSSIEVVTNDEPISYSSILKSKKKSEPPKASTKNPIEPIPEKTEEKKKVKKKDPISLDLFTALQVRKQQPKKNATVLAGKLKKEPIVKSVRNALDSSAPTKKRGKEREGGKKKKKTLMKKIILADREKRRLLREEAEKRREERIKAGVSLKPLPQKDDDFNSVKKESHEVELISEDAGNQENSQEVVEVNDASISADKILEISADVSSNQKLDPVIAETDTPAKTPLEVSTDEKALTAIHSRKFRSYCTHLLSPELDSTVSLLMADLVRFQDKQHAKDPVKAKAKRRFVVGLREVAKFLKVKKINCIILAPDIERVETEGGLDDAVSKLIADSKAQEIKTVFGLNRRKLGKLCLKKVPISCIGIMNYQGSDDNYKNMLSLASNLTVSYQARFQAEIEKITSPPQPPVHPPTRPHSSNSVLSTTAAAFIPSGSVVGGGEGYYDYYGNYCDYSSYYENSYYSGNYYGQDYNYLQDYKQNLIDILRH